MYYADLDMLKEKQDLMYSVELDLTCGSLPLGAEIPSSLLTIHH